MSVHSTVFRIKTALREGWRCHGPSLPFVVLHRFSIYTIRKLIGRRAFQLADRSYRYVIHPFILDNERTVEVALALDFLQGQTGAILEVGNVLANFASFPHEVVDKYEKAPGVINEDIVSFDPGKKYERIVTLSTLEHVGWDEQPRDPAKLPQAIAHLKELLSEGGELLATLPLGYNPHVDQMVRKGRTGFAQVRFLRRISANNQWREASLKEVEGAQFGCPYGCANALVIGWYRRENQA
jgi:hypothetical protein